MGINSDYHVLAVDIEVSGSSYHQNGIVSIGASLQDQDSHELHSFQINLSLPEGHIYEEKCLQEFWLKNKEAYGFIQTNAFPPKVAMEAFYAFLKQVETQYPDLLLVSDNPSFDISWLNFYLNQYTNRLPLNYSADKKYRMVWDTQSMQKVLLCLSGDFDSNSEIPEKLGFKSNWTYDHTPLNDARTIADFFNQTVKEMKRG